MSIPVLNEIIARKQVEIAALKSRTTLAELHRRAGEAGPPRDFFAAVKAPPAGVDFGIIAEIKRRSPSAGAIGAHAQDASFAPQQVGSRYEAAGAAAISCLTDEFFFNGRLEFLDLVRRAVKIPVLRKDFIVDQWQIVESRAAGADAVLLIAECLTGGQIAPLLGLAHRLGMAVLLELHDEENLDRCLRAMEASPGPTLLGVNNRDLRTMTVDRGRTGRICARVPDPSILVAESGIRTRGDLDALAGLGVRIALVGEQLMSRPDPGGALTELLSPGSPMNQ